MRRFDERADQGRSEQLPLRGIAGEQHELLRLQRLVGNTAIARVLATGALNVQRFQHGRPGVIDNGRVTADTDARSVRGRGRLRLSAGSYVEVLSGPFGSPAEFRVRVWSPGRRGAECIIPAASFATEPQLADRREGRTSAPDRQVIGYLPAAGPLFGPSGRPEPTDVHQGTLGDCYLMAAVIAVLQINPDYIASLFTGSPVMGADGVRAYHVALRVARRRSDGAAAFRLSDRLVSADFPHLRVGQEQTPAYSGLLAGVRQPIWPMLLEKRYAMREGGYDDLEGGHSDTVMEALTGRPARRNEDPDLRAEAERIAGAVGSTVTARDTDPLQAESDAGLVTLIEQYRTQGRPVVLGTPNNYSDQSGRTESRRLHVHTNHGYPVVSAGAGVVRLRNPWGRDHPTRALTGEEIKRLFVEISVGDSLTGPNRTPPARPPAGPNYQ